MRRSMLLGWLGALVLVAGACTDSGSPDDSSGRGLAVLHETVLSAAFEGTVLAEPPRRGRVAVRVDRVLWALDETETSEGGVLDLVLVEEGMTVGLGGRHELRVGDSYVFVVSQSGFDQPDNPQWQPHAIYESQSMEPLPESRFVEPPLDVILRRGEAGPEDKKRALGEYLAEAADRGTERRRGLSARPSPGSRLGLAMIYLAEKGFGRPADLPVTLPETTAVFGREPKFEKLAGYEDQRGPREGVTLGPALVTIDGSKYLLPADSYANRKCREMNLEFGESATRAKDPPCYVRVEVDDDGTIQDLWVLRVEFAENADPTSAAPQSITATATVVDVTDGVLTTSSKWLHGHLLWALAPDAVFVCRDQTWLPSQFPQEPDRDVYEFDVDVETGQVTNLRCR